MIYCSSPFFFLSLTSFLSFSITGGKNGSFKKAQFSSPWNIAFDKDRNCLYVVDQRNHCIRCLNLSTGEVTTLIGQIGVSGNAIQGFNATQLNHPKVLVLDLNGNLIVSDSFNHRILFVDVSERSVSSFGTGVQGYKDGDANIAQFNEPYGVSVGANGTIYVADCGNDCIRRVCVFHS